MNIKNIDPETLIPRQSNSRTHSNEQIGQIAASITEFGFTNPILVDSDNVIVAGHGRAMAAIRLGLELVPTVELSGLTDTQIKAYVIADNQLALNAGWDFDILGAELEELKELDFDIDLLGFDEGMTDHLSEQEDSGPIFKEIDEVSLSKKCPRCNFEYD